MSNQQNVWVGSINFTHVNIYSIGMNFPNVFNPIEQQKIQSKIIKMRNLEEYKNSSEFADLRKKNKELTSVIIEIEEKFQRFKKLAVLPNKLLIVVDNEPLPSLSEYMFKVRGGGVVLNEACANILKQFNLGETTITPVNIHKYDSTELWSEETFYFLNSCEQREYVKATQPEEYFTYDNHLIKNRTHRLKVEMADNHLELDQSATDCDVDLWHDPLFAMSYFFSERLHNALVESGLDKKWNMHRCKLTSQ